jgi:hypothetical protein
MDEWFDISSAPKDGRTIRTRRVVDGEVLFERDAAWRTVSFPAYNDNGLFVPEEEMTGWMYPYVDKRVPSPTHWKPL